MRVCTFEELGFMMSAREFRGILQMDMFSLITLVPRKAAAKNAVSFLRLSGPSGGRA